ncbi:MAG: hypothetical protein HRT81_08095 [Henriciella sp.]|nr:hypothetical protein [Henriciella sp.]
MSIFVRFLSLRVGRLFAVIALAATTFSGTSFSEQNTRQAISQGELIQLLREGGHVLLIRHERTEVPSREDDYTRPVDDCRAQRNLSIAGLAGAQETGVVLDAVGIPVTRVISSPMCRSAETARLMFGVGYEVDVRLLHHDPKGERNLDIAEDEARELLLELAPGSAGSNIALIGHSATITRVSGLRLSEGEIGVVRLSESGEAVSLGQFMGSDLAPLARLNLSFAD